MESAEMTLQGPAMEISITEFKNRCLEIIRELEKSGRPVLVTRRGMVVARLEKPTRPRERLQRLGGRLMGDPGESVLHDSDFEPRLQ
jgi:antitoxin (DNA-binding transcriptional repressor) of toxin-antitoxin stability system